MKQIFSISLCDYILYVAEYSPAQLEVMDSIRALSGNNLLMDFTAILRSMSFYNQNSHCLRSILIWSDWL